MFYSLFGFHAARGLWNKGGDPGDFMEETYSLFGFTAKLTLFWSKYFDESQVGVGIGSALSLIATLGATVYLDLAAQADKKPDAASEADGTMERLLELERLFRQNILSDPEADPEADPEDDKTRFTRLLRVQLTP